MNIGVIFLVRQYLTQIMTNSKHTAVDKSFIVNKSNMHDEPRNSEH